MKYLLAILFLATLYGAPATASDGHYEIRYQTVVVCPGRYERVWMPASYFCGRLVRHPYWAEHYVPPRYTQRPVQVWVPEIRGSGGVSWQWRLW